MREFADRRKQPLRGVVKPMLYIQTASIEILLMMLLIETTLTSILSSIHFMMHLFVKHMDSSKIN